MPAKRNPLDRIWGGAATAGGCLLTSGRLGHVCLSPQILSLDSILGAGGRSAEGFRRQEQLRALSLSVFYQCARLLVHQSSVKSLTGFGPAAAQDDFLKARTVRASAASDRALLACTLL